MTEKFSAGSVPSWRDFLAFEQAFTVCLERISTIRRGGHVCWVSKRPGSVSVTEPVGLYSPLVRQCIDEEVVLLTRGSVGSWLVEERRLWLDEAFREIRHSASTSLVGRGVTRTDSLDAGSVRQYQERERDLRFFGEFAGIFGRYHHKTWSSFDDTKEKVLKFGDQARRLERSLTRLMEDRYLKRCLTHQDLGAVQNLVKLLEGIPNAFEFVVEGEHTLQPFLRWHDGREAGLRQAIAFELIDLCMASYGDCPSAVLKRLLAGMEIELPTNLSPWLKKQRKTWTDLSSLQSSARKAFSGRLPRVYADDPRRPQYAVLPWLDPAESVDQ